MDVLQQFTSTEAAFRSGRLHEFAWEGDNDSGWALPTPVNCGSAVFMYPKEPLEKCEWCGAYYCREDQNEHMIKCPSRPEWLSSMPTPRKPQKATVSPPVKAAVDLAPDEVWEKERADQLCPWEIDGDPDWEKLMQM